MVQYNYLNTGSKMNSSFKAIFNSSKLAKMP